MIQSKTYCFSENDNSQNIVSDDTKIYNPTMALQKTNLFCTKQNNIANTTFDLPKYTCNNSVFKQKKITFRQILAVQPLVTQPFDLATF